MSLSVRRAWIEIKMSQIAGMYEVVALRKESVDRNIKGNPYLQIGRQVALRKESVDRNNGAGNSARKQLSRSP